MIRMLISVGIKLLANAVGLMIAAWVLPDMTIDGAAFVLAVVIFTVVEVVLDPLFTKIALTKASALRGGVALVTTLVGLIVTDAVSDGLSISGFTTWLLATVIVWLAAMIALLLLPLVLVKKAVDNR